MSSYVERMAKKAKKPMNRVQRRAHKQPQEPSKMQIASRIRKRVQHRIMVEGADWMKQLRRQQRNQPGVITGSPELKAAAELKALPESEQSDAAKRYKSIKTPAQLEAEREERGMVADQRANRKRR